MLKMICVCGTRPNFIKIAPIVEACARSSEIEVLLVHTGQHYDEKMSHVFFDELQLPEPDLNLGVGSGSHAVQTAEVMRRFEPVCLEHQPDWVVVVGDVNSTLSSALVAAKLSIGVAHVEAGLRSFDRTMPEEVNRVLTDAISDLLFVTERSGLENLKHEGIADCKVHFVGNVMIDTLTRHRAEAEASTILERFGLVAKRYVAVTLHRPDNVDEAGTLTDILRALETISVDQPVVFPIHPRTQRNLAGLGLMDRVDAITNLQIIDPLGYMDFLKLISDASVVLTDSGGIQEETTILGVPCLTLRDNTERPVTITNGTNRLVGRSTETIIAAYRTVRANPPVVEHTPELWDGRAADRIVTALLRTG